MKVQRDWRFGYFRAASAGYRQQFKIECKRFNKHPVDCVRQNLPLEKFHPRLRVMNFQSGENAGDRIVD